MSSDKFYAKSIIKVPAAKESCIKQVEYRLAEALLQKLKEANNEPLLVRLESEIKWESTEYGYFEVYCARLKFDMPEMRKFEPFPCIRELKWYEKMWRKIKKLF